MDRGCLAEVTEIIDAFYDKNRKELEELVKHAGPLLNREEHKRSENLFLICDTALDIMAAVRKEYVPST